MNPLTKVKLINELNEREARLGVKDSVSWHQDYKDSAWIFMGGLPFELTEGDIICVFSQYGEVVNINLVRDKASGKSRGFCFLCYEDQRSTVLAVDNLNGIKLKGRTIRVDHVADYRPPKDAEDIDEVTKTLREKGCGAQTASSEEEEETPKIKKHKKKKKKKRKGDDDHSKERNSPLRVNDKIKKERHDPGYEKYSNKQTTSIDGMNQRNSSDDQSTSGSSYNKQTNYFKESHLKLKPNSSKDKHHAEEKRHLKDHERKRHCR
ncbi:RNA-binding motif protein, X-linked 2 [Gastrophryne carolinensis]